MQKITLIAVCAFVLSFIVPLVSVAADEVGQNAYKRCASCHLPTGEGVPSAYPPINERLTSFMVSEKGREYLIMVVNSGIMGPISVDGVSYFGVMPAQGSALKNKGIADVLNYIATELSTVPNDFEEFNEAEVVAVKAKHPRANFRTAHGLRQEAMESVE